MNVLQFLFSFRGRINRAKYWLASAIYVGALYLALHLIANVLDSGGVVENLIAELEKVFSADATLRLAMLLLIIVSAPVFVSAAAVGIKRLHDRGKSGWWLLLFYGVPGALSAIASRFDEASNLHLAFDLAELAVVTWAIVELGFLRGTPGPNRYGPVPRVSRIARTT